MLATKHVDVGDVLAVRTPGSFAAKVIRLGAALRDEPNLDNHIAIVHHRDAQGTLWCLEGRPGGVGWRQSSDYVRNAYTVSNVNQPKTDEQRQLVASEAVKLIGTDYDWEAIESDALQTFGIRIPGWKPNFGTGVPAHVDCSGYAAYVYAHAELAHPAGGRSVTPADWVDLILRNHWEG